MIGHICQEGHALHWMTSETTGTMPIVNTRLVLAKARLNKTNHQGGQDCQLGGWRVPPIQSTCKCPGGHEIMYLLGPVHIASQKPQPMVVGENRHLGPVHTLAKLREEKRLDQWKCRIAQSPSSHPSHQRPKSKGRRLQKEPRLQHL